MAKLLLELELTSLEDGSEHDLKYFYEDLKEFFENFGWKLIKSSYEEGEDSDCFVLDNEDILE
jgi:hypothetical protein